MGKIVAIGGGEIGRPGTRVETRKIDQEIVRLTGKKHPRLLFIPTASSDAEGYIQTVRKYFGQRLGCKIDTLLLVKKKPSPVNINRKVLGADIIYVGGGDTLKMLKIWRKTGLDKVLKQAYQKGAVLSGISAGAVCWFRYANSDSRTFQKSKAKFSYMRLVGLDFVSLIMSPHHIREKSRKEGLIAIMKKTPGIGIALDDYAALEIVDNSFRIITSKPFAKVHKVYFQGNRLIYREVKQEKTWLPLSILTER